MAPGASTRRGAGGNIEDIGLTNTALSALVAAWTTTTIAITLLAAALALSQVWDGAVFLHAVRDTLARPG
jgi:hypothetical protein